MTKLSRLAGFALVAVFFLAGTVTGCLGTEIKDKTSTGKLKFSATDTANSTTFKFNFAYDDSTNDVAYLQGAANTKNTMISTCGATGSNCVCEFLNGAGVLLTPTTTPVISYNTLGNYYSCDYSVDGSLPATTASIRLRNSNSTKYSAIYTLDTSATLTLTKLLGDLSVAKVRSILRYTCRHQFLNKINTSRTTGYFDCSSQAQCGATALKDLCIIRMNYPYFLYADAVLSNVNKRPVDQLYNAALGGQICGMQVTQFECTVNGNGNTDPTKQFGIYSQEGGVFDTAISLFSAPNQASETYGYVAQATGTKCPPGLELWTRREVTPNTAADFADSNYPTAGMLATDYAKVTVPPSTTTITPVKNEGGVCTSNTCTYDGALANNNLTVATYVDAGTAFCAIPFDLIEDL